MSRFLQYDLFFTFCSSQTAPVSLNGLKALCSLGLTQGDLQLAGAVMQELGTHAESNGEHLADYATFSAVMIALQVRCYFG